jgi:hypothetical protein
MARDMHDLRDGYECPDCEEKKAEIKRLKALLAEIDQSNVENATKELTKQLSLATDLLREYAKTWTPGSGWSGLNDRTKSFLSTIDKGQMTKE